MFWSLYNVCNRWSFLDFVPTYSCLNKTVTLQTLPCCCFCFPTHYSCSVQYLTALCTTSSKNSEAPRTLAPMTLVFAQDGICEDNSSKHNLYTTVKLLFKPINERSENLNQKTRATIIDPNSSCTQKLSRRDIPLTVLWCDLRKDRDKKRKLTVNLTALNWIFIRAVYFFHTVHQKWPVLCELAHF